jgi:parallel beta-helix repeat protein
MSNLRKTCLLVTAAILIFSTFSLAAEFFVAENGDNGNPGTKEKPFATLEAARDAVRSSGKDTVTVVNIRQGRYFRDKTFELGKKDSGTEQNPVVYRAYKGEKVIIDGGILLKAVDFTPVTDKEILSRIIEESARPNIWQIDLKKYGIRDFGELGARGFRRPYRPAPLELFIDGVPQRLSRWPEQGGLNFGKVIEPGSVPRFGDFSLEPAVFEYETSRPENWTKAKDLYISGIFNYGYADDTIKAAEIDTGKKTIKTAMPHLYGLHKRDFTYWFALNLLEEISSPGEYYVEKESGILYCYPSDLSADSVIQVSILEDVMVAMEDVSHVKLENLIFENSRSSGIYIESGSSNLIAGCTLRNLGELAVQIGRGIEPYPAGLYDTEGGFADSAKKVYQPISRRVGSWHEHIYEFPAFDYDGGAGHKVLSCDMYNTGTGGILLGGGNRKTLTPAGNTVENCDIYNINRLDTTYKAHINVHGVGNRILNNHLHDAPGMAVYVHGNDHVIRFNEIDHVLKDISDQGSIYMGCDHSELGHKIEYNFFHHLFNFHQGGHGVQAIFLDDDILYPASIFGNVFYKTGNTGVIKFNGGGGASIANNIAIDSPRLLQIGPTVERAIERALDKINDPDDIKYKRIHQSAPEDFSGVDLTKEPYKSRYPYVCHTVKTGEFLGTPQWNNYIVKDDLSQFEDPDRLDFSIKKGSPILNKTAYNVKDHILGINAAEVGFKDIPFGKIGLYTDRFRTEIPQTQASSTEQGYKLLPEDYNYAMRIYNSPEQELVFPNPHPDAQWFPKAGLGLFMHWGIHSVKALQPSWSMIKDYPYAHYPKDEDPNKYIGMNYYHLAEEFNPDSYDPDKWMKAAADAGFRYAVLTAKHHDGYALWPSEYGNMSTRTYMGGRDLIKDYVDACRKNGLKVGFYFSPRDWHFPGFPMGDVGFDNNRRGEEYEMSDEAAKELFLDFYAYTICQIRELLTNYGKIDIMWFDGLGAWPGIKDKIGDTKVLQTYQWIRNLQPGIVINDRWDKRIGDFATPEMHVPENEIDGCWESCIAIKGHWGYSPEREIWSIDKFCNTYNTIRKKGGNFLANIGPAPDGTMPPEFYQLCEKLKEGACGGN